MDVLEWSSENTLTDPTCGSGTFLLEAIRRRRKDNTDHSAQSLLEGLSGIDLNPLAVLAAKGSLTVFLSPYLDPSKPVRLPVYLADAINPATIGADSNYSHILHTELGPKEFSVPEKMISHADFFKVFAKIRMLIDADYSANKISNAILDDLKKIELDEIEISVVTSTVKNLISLHEQGWNGIWCSILADRFAAGAIPASSHICGNPPWVKWSNLPSEYAQSIQKSCRDLGVFSTDNWVGGIEADISTLVTYQAVKHYLAPKGKLGFFLPGSVFTTESSAGFRKFSIGQERIPCKVLQVQDFEKIRPFDGVSNHTTYLTLQKDEVTQFPVSYGTWAVNKEIKKDRNYPSAERFKAEAVFTKGIAVPVPGGDGARPWLIGSVAEQAVFAKVFADKAKPEYQARKGVTTDRNGIFWVHPQGDESNDCVSVKNAANIGRTKGIPEITGIIDTDHLFPLLRGRDVQAFTASLNNNLRIILPQRGMHGDPELPEKFPRTYKYLNKFRNHLEARSSLKRFQKNQPFYSLWSTGPYTFSPFKVLWREMGNKFAAAYVGSIDMGGKQKTIIPDHKLYFIPIDSEMEAAYLTGFLNAPTIANAVSAYAAQLSLGVSVAEYLKIPKYSQLNKKMVAISDIAKTITLRSGAATSAELKLIDSNVRSLLGI